MDSTNGADRPRKAWAKASRIKTAALAVAVFCAAAASALAQNLQEEEVQPAPSATGADVPQTYFGPWPSDVKREYVGPYQLLKSGKLDIDKATITLPLYEGAMKSGQTVWYIVTDTDDIGNAAALGINYSAKLTYADVGRTVRTATLDHNFKLVFDAGAVDFSPKRSVTPGDAPNFFPPKQFQPSGVGDKDYTPLVKITNAGGHIYNAPVVAYNVSADVLNQFCDGHPDHSLVHQKVVKICPRDQTVTLQLTTGFSFSRPVYYLSTDTNNKLTAALEGATYAPGLEDITWGGRRQPVQPDRAYFRVRQRPNRQGQSAEAGPGQRAIRRRRPAQRARRHSHRRDRLQPDLGPQSVGLDAKGN